MLGNLIIKLIMLMIQNGINIQLIQHGGNQSETIQKQRGNRLEH